MVEVPTGSVNTDEFAHLGIPEAYKITDFIDLEQIDYTLPKEILASKIIANLKTVGFFALTNVPGIDEAEILRNY